MLASALPGSFCPSSSLPLLIVLSVALATLAIYQEAELTQNFQLEDFVCPLDAFMPGHFLSLLKKKSFMCCFSSFWSQFMLLPQRDFAQPHPVQNSSFFYYPESVFLHHSILFISFIASQSIYVFVYFCIFLPGDCIEGLSDSCFHI